MLKFFFRRLNVIYLIFSFLFYPAVLRVSATYSENADYTLIQSAENAVSSAYDSVLEAESAAANVTQLILDLNEAVTYLSSAENLFRNGDPDDVFELTSRSIEIANIVKNKAAVLRSSALAERDFVSKASFIGSVAGVCVFLAFMLLFWGWFKRHYVRRLLDMKPEVAENKD
jgi:hypothetical protein